MPRKQKTTQNNGNANGAAKAPRAKSTTPPKKTPAKAASGKRKTKTAAAPVTEPSNEEIQLRAYFIAERRHRLALPGDADSDWLEAKRQLVSELAR